MPEIKVVKRTEPTQADKLREAVNLANGQKDRADKMFTETVIDILERLESLEKRVLTT